MFSSRTFIDGSTGRSRPALPAALFLVGVCSVAASGCSLTHGGGKYNDGLPSPTDYLIFFCLLVSWITFGAPFQ